MPHPARANRRQWAVLWPFLRRNAYGRSVVDEPVEIKVRWDDRSHLPLGPGAQTNDEVEQFDAAAVVGQDITIGSLMWLGTTKTPLDEWYGTGSTGQSDKLMEVVAFDNIPDLKANVFLKVVGLMRYKDSPEDS